jgi:hypothetical protein
VAIAAAVLLWPVISAAGVAWINVPIGWPSWL